MSEYFLTKTRKPYHLSIGGVLINEENEVCVHYFKEIRGFKDLYILMRETINTGESIEECLHRGLKEEFGAEGEIVAFLGNTTTFYNIDEVEIEKTTLYLLCKLISQDLGLRSNEDIESTSEVKWINIDEALEIFKNQKIEPEQDEYKILQRAKSYLQSHQ